MSLRTPIGRARGLGTAKEGTRHWWLQRISAVALIPLAVWFVAALVGLTGAAHAEVVAWLANPVVALLIVLLVAATFYHAQLGMQVVYEDYIHSHWLRISADGATKLAAAALAVAAVIAVLKVALGG